MFLTFEYGVMYVLSFATIITVFATTIALAVLLVMIACRSIWRLLRRRKEPFQAPHTRRKIVFGPMLPRPM